jgi:hypothetical protein
MDRQRKIGQALADIHEGGAADHFEQPEGAFQITVGFPRKSDLCIVERNHN